MDDKNKFNLKQIGTFLTMNNFWHKSFNSFTNEEIGQFCAAVFNSHDIKPTIDNSNVITKCRICGGRKFWRFTGETNNWTCEQCHPSVKGGTKDKEMLFLEISNYYYNRG